MTDPREPYVEPVADAVVECVVNLSERSERHAKHSQHRLDPGRERLVVVSTEQHEHRCMHNNVQTHCHRMRRLKQIG